MSLKYFQQHLRGFWKYYVHRAFELDLKNSHKCSAHFLLYADLVLVPYKCGAMKFRVTHFEAGQITSVLLVVQIIYTDTNYIHRYFGKR